MAGLAEIYGPEEELVDGESNEAEAEGEAESALQEWVQRHIDMLPGFVYATVLVIFAWILRQKWPYWLLVLALVTCFIFVQHCQGWPILLWWHDPGQEEEEEFEEDENGVVDGEPGVERQVRVFTSAAVCKAEDADWDEAGVAEGSLPRDDWITLTVAGGEDFQNLRCAAMSSGSDDERNGSGAASGQMSKARLDLFLRCMAAADASQHQQKTDATPQRQRLQRKLLQRSAGVAEASSMEVGAGSMAASAPAAEEGGDATGAATDATCGGGEELLQDLSEEQIEELLRELGEAEAPGTKASGGGPKAAGGRKDTKCSPKRAARRKTGGGPTKPPAGAAPQQKASAAASGPQEQEQEALSTAALHQKVLPTAAAGSRSGPHKEEEAQEKTKSAASSDRASGSQVAAVAAEAVQTATAAHTLPSSDKDAGIEDDEGFLLTEERPGDFQVVENRRAKRRTRRTAASTARREEEEGATPGEHVAATDGAPEASGKDTANERQESPRSDACGAGARAPVESTVDTATCLKTAAPVEEHRDSVSNALPDEAEPIFGEFGRQVGGDVEDEAGEEEEEWEWQCPSGNSLEPYKCPQALNCSSCSKLLPAGARVLWSSVSGWVACEDCINMAYEQPVVAPQQDESSPLLPEPAKMSALEIAEWFKQQGSDAEEALRQLMVQVASGQAPGRSG